MKKKAKKRLSALLALFMVFSVAATVLPFTAFAEDGGQTEGEGGGEGEGEGEGGQTGGEGEGEGEGGSDPTEEPAPTYADSISIDGFNIDGDVYGSGTVTYKLGNDGTVKVTVDLGYSSYIDGSVSISSDNHGKVDTDNIKVSTDGNKVTFEFLASADTYYINFNNKKSWDADDTYRSTVTASSDNAEQQSSERVYNPTGDYYGESVSFSVQDGDGNTVPEENCSISGDTSGLSLNTEYTVTVTLNGDYYFDGDTQEARRTFRIKSVGGSPVDADGNEVSTVFYCTKKEETTGTLSITITGLDGVEADVTVNNNTSTTSGGYVSFDNVDFGDVSVYATAEGYDALNDTAYGFSKDNTSFEFSMTKTAPTTAAVTVYVYCADEDRYLSEASVTLGGNTQSCGDSGAVFTDLTVGDYFDISGSADGYTVSSDSVTVSADGNTVTLSASKDPEPTEEPTAEPTEEPTQEPAPTEEPTQEPEPTDEPTEAPTDEPTAEPTAAPTVAPTDEPTAKPTSTPKATTEPSKVSFTVVINWDDDNNTAGKRPSSITVQLKNKTTGDIIDTKKPSTSNNWTISWTKLDGTISYTLSLPNTPEGYTRTNTSDGSTYYITYKYEGSSATATPAVSATPASTPSGNVSVAVDIYWVDNSNTAGARPSEISVQLKRDGEVYDTKSASSSNNWYVSWSGLDSTHKWSVSAPGTPSGYTKTGSASGNTVTLTYTYQGSAPVVTDKPIGTLAPVATENPWVTVKPSTSPSYNGAPTPTPDDDIEIEVDINSTPKPTTKESSSGNWFLWVCIGLIVLSAGGIVTVITILVINRRKNKM